MGESTVAEINDAVTCTLGADALEARRRAIEAALGQLD